MAVTWITTQYPGVRCYEHARRKTRNGQSDRYFTIRYRVNGVRAEEGLGWASEGWNAEKAYKLLSDIKTGVRTGSGPQSLAEKRALAETEREALSEAKRQEAFAGMSLEVFFRGYYMPQVKRGKRSWLTDEQRIVKTVIPAIGKLPLRAVQKADVQHFIDGLVDSGLASATVKQYMGLVRRAYNIATQTLVENFPLFEGPNPATGLRLPTVHNARDRYLTAAEAKALIEAAGTLRSPDLQDAIILSLNTGLRLGEFMRLTWPDVDMISGMVTVPDEDKRKPGGKVPVNAAARAVFERRRSIKNPGAQVFPPVAGGAVRSNLSAVFRRLVDTIGLNAHITDKRHRLVFHSLRHTFASWLALAGVDIYRIKTLMRHHNITMTMRYAHLIPNATRDAVHNLCPPKDF